MSEVFPGNPPTPPFFNPPAPTPEPAPEPVVPNEPVVTPAAVSSGRREGDEMTVTVVPA